MVLVWIWIWMWSNMLVFIFICLLIYNNHVHVSSCSLTHSMAASPFLPLSSLYLILPLSLFLNTHPGITHLASVIICYFICFSFSLFLPPNHFISTSTRSLKHKCDCHGSNTFDKVPWSGFNLEELKQQCLIFLSICLSLQLWPFGSFIWPEAHTVWVRVSRWKILRRNKWENKIWMQELLTIFFYL